MNSSPVKKILILLANPKNLDRRCLDQEVREIHEGLKRAKQQEQFELEQQWAVRPRDLQRAILDSNPQIVHFSGHGVGDEGLALEDETGQAKLVSTQALAELFELFADQIECVLLNACYSEVQATAIAQHIPHVIGMTNAVGDRAALEFAIGFYDALGAGKTIELAYKLGCNRIRLAGISEHLTPVLKKKANANRLPNGIPDTSTFYGRSQEIDRLKQWIIQDRSRLIAILGMGGIGKTSLAASLARRLQDEFQHVVWLSLRDAPPIESILTDLLKNLSSEDKFESQETFNEKIAKILSYLNSFRCLLILDNVEAILEKERYTGQYREGYAQYSTLFRKIGESSHQSCLVLTSREKPKEITELDGENSTVRSLELKGLKAEAQKILRDKGLTGSQEEFRKLIALYNGHPLALSIVPETIKNSFDGNITQFLSINVAIVDDGIFTLLEEQFERLSSVEKNIIYWLAINREPISPLELENDISSFSVKRKDLFTSINSLRSRSLIETIKSHSTLQNVIMEYVTDRLVKQIIEEIKTETPERYYGVCNRSVSKTNN